MKYVLKGLVSAQVDAKIFQEDMYRGRQFKEKQKILRLSLSLGKEKGATSLPKFLS